MVLGQASVTTTLWGTHTSLLAPHSAWTNLNRPCKGETVWGKSVGPKPLSKHWLRQNDSGLDEACNESFRVCSAPVTAL